MASDRRERKMLLPPLPIIYERLGEIEIYERLGEIERERDEVRKILRL